jgi:hypothetical protein
VTASAGTLNGTPCTRMRMQLGSWGAWHVDADLAESVALAGTCEVKLADVTASGTVIAGGVANGRAAYRVVGGKAGWSTALAARGYSNDAGVKVALVLADAARECGETLGTPLDTRMGPHFARRAMAGYELLNELAPAAWYVDLAGVTQFGTRPTTAYSGDGARSRVEPAAGVVEITTDAIAALVPGVVVDGAAPATDVEYLLEESRLVVRVYARRGLSRQLDALKRIYLALFPDVRYRGTFEYRVTTRDGERLNLQPVRVASGMPSLARVPVRPGVAGMRADVQLGELVLVTFADADPSRPNVIAHDAADAPGWLPELIEAGDSTDFLAKAAPTNARLDALEQWAQTTTFPTGVGPSGTSLTPLVAGAGDVATTLLKGA